MIQHWKYELQEKTIAFEKTRQQLYNKLILMYETALANPVAYLKQKCKWFDQKYFFYILTLLS